LKFEIGASVKTPPKMLSIVLNDEVSDTTGADSNPSCQSC